MIGRAENSLSGVSSCVDMTRPAPDVIAGFEEFATIGYSTRLTEPYTMSSAIKNVTNDSLRVLGPGLHSHVFPWKTTRWQKSSTSPGPGDVAFRRFGSTHRRPR